MNVWLNALLVWSFGGAALFAAVYVLILDRLWLLARNERQERIWATVVRLLVAVSGPLAWLVAGFLAAREAIFCAWNKLGTDE